MGRKYQVNTIIVRTSYSTCTGVFNAGSPCERRNLRIENDFLARETGRDRRDGRNLKDERQVSGPAQSWRGDVGCSRTQPKCANTSNPASLLRSGLFAKSFRLAASMSRERTDILNGKRTLQKTWFGCWISGWLAA